MTSAIALLRGHRTVLIVAVLLVLVVAALAALAGISVLAADPMAGT